MNIFYLSHDPAECAAYHCDKHISKMIVETAQLLSAAHHMTGSERADQCYKLTHKNHPCAVWVRSSEQAYGYTLDLLSELCAEYTRRYSKTHKTKTTMLDTLSYFPDLPGTDWTEPPQCMPDEYKSDNTIESYRNYYREEKTFAKWAWSPTPHWYTNA